MNDYTLLNQFSHMEQFYVAMDWYAFRLDEAPQSFHLNYEYDPIFSGTVERAKYTSAL